MNNSFFPCNIYSRGEGTGETKERSQKNISQGEALSSSLDCAVLDVCCGDAINGCEAVTGAVLAGAQNN